MHPRIARPGFVSRLTRSRNRVETPDLFAGVRVPGGDESANAELAAGHPCDYLVLDDQRRMRHGIALVGIGGLCFPEFLAAFGVESDYGGVERRHENLVAQNRQAARFLPAAVPGSRVRLVEIPPDGFAGGGIEGEHVVDALDGVHDSIHYQRRDLVFLDRPGLEDPLQREVFGVVRSDLCESAMALTHQAAGIGEPVLRFLAGAEEPRERDAGNGSFVIDRSGKLLSPDQRRDREQQEHVCLHRRYLIAERGTTAMRAALGVYPLPTSIHSLRAVSTTSHS